MNLTIHQAAELSFRRAGGNLSDDVLNVLTSTFGDDPPVIDGKVIFAGTDHSDRLLDLVAALNARRNCDAEVGRHELIVPRKSFAVLRVEGAYGPLPTRVIDEDECTAFDAVTVKGTTRESHAGYYQSAGETRFYWVSFGGHLLIVGTMSPRFRAEWDSRTHAAA